MFADDIVRTDFKPARFPLVFQILRRVANRGKGENLRPGANRCPPFDNNMGVENDAFFKADIRTDDTIGADSDAGCDFRFGIDDRS